MIQWCSLHPTIWADELNTVFDVLPPPCVITASSLFYLSPTRLSVLPKTKKKLWS